MVEKALASTRAATKASAVEAVLLYIELDTPGPVIEDLLPGVSHKVPKTIAATLACLTTVFHNYGCKTVDPKPVLKVLPKAFGHADKNVRAESTKLAVEFYRWLREAMKPMFWGDLKPTQQTDLEAQFEKIKAEPPPKQERLLRSQQEAMEAAGGDGGDGGDEGGEDEEPEEVDAYDLAEPQDINSKISAEFWTALGSAKWKDRKEALEGLFAIVNVPRIKEADYNELTRVLAKCMKDANIMVVMQAAGCIEALAKGLRRGFGKYRSTVQAPIMERLKEKKQNVADALGAALDQVFLATSLTDCMEDIVAFLGHKNPQVKEGTMKFLIRCLKTTREMPSKPEITSIVECAKKLLAESSEGLRSGGAEVLGTVMKIIGERAMNPHLEGLDDIRKTKIKEFYETAEVKAKEKPKAAPPPPKAAPAAKKPVAKKAPVKKAAAPAAAAAAAPAEAPLAPQPTARPTSKLGVPKPGLKAPRGRRGGPGGLASPRRVAAPPVEEEEEEEAPAPPPPQPRIGLGRGGPAARSLARPARPASPQAPPSPSPPSGLSSLERAELEELRAANERLTRLSEELRHDRSKLASEVQELKNQNAGLIEDHTRDVLSIKAKETQLVRARSDAEATEQVNERLRRELDRLKRALSLAEGVGPGSPRVMSPTHDEGYRDGMSSSRHRSSFTSSMSEERENGEHAYPAKYSSDLRYGSGTSGRGSPARGYRDEGRPQSVASGGSGQGGGGVESWKRAAEVTSQLKARIEQMKVSFPYPFTTPISYLFLSGECGTNELQAKQNMTR